MKQPEYVRGAGFRSHAHYWEYASVRAYVDGAVRVHGAIIWRKRRTYVRT